VGIAVTGCGAGAVDYSTLKSAAEARQRQAGMADPATERNVRELLARPLDAQAVSQVVLLNNRGARALVEELNVARANLTSARHLPNPTLEGAMRFHDGDRPAIELGALLSVTDLLLLAARSGAAESGVEAAKLSAVANLLDLSFEARRAFFEYQAALQTLELRQNVADAFAASADASQRLRDAGNTTELALANERAALADARIELQRGQLRVSAAREHLNTLMGLSAGDTRWKAQQRLPELPRAELDVKDLEAQAVRRSLDLELTKQRFAAAAKRANIARAAGFIPEVRAGVSAEREESWAVGPAVELQLPLFYQGQGEVGVAEAERRQQEHLYADTAVRLRAAARVAAAELAAARDRVTYSRDVLLPLRQKVVDETQLQYNAMLVGVFQLLQAKREQIAAGATYIEQLREYWTARSHVEQLLAGRMTGAPVSGATSEVDQVPASVHAE
jgi:cobalt-zinc-cadmium efflux system outer membrane protein